MSNEFKALAQFLAPIASSAVYTAPATAPTIVRKDGIVAVNTNVTTKRTLKLRVSGSLAQNFIWITEIPKEGTAIAPVSPIVPSAGTIEAEADVAGEVAVGIFGLEKKS